MRTIQFRRVSHALVDTRFECGLRLPKALRACESLECRTHSWTHSSSVPSNSLRPFRPVRCSDGARTRVQACVQLSQKSSVCANCSALVILYWGMRYVDNFHWDRNVDDRMTIMLKCNIFISITTSPNCLLVRPIQHRVLPYAPSINDNINLIWYFTRFILGATEIQILRWVSKSMFCHKFTVFITLYVVIVMWTMNAINIFSLVKFPRCTYTGWYRNIVRSARVCYTQ